MQEQAMQDAEAELLEQESEQLQQLSRQLDAELAAVQKRAAMSAKAEPDSIESSSSPLATHSSGETSQGSLQSSTVTCKTEDPLQQHHTMYEAYEYLVSRMLCAEHTVGSRMLHMAFSTPPFSSVRRCLTAWHVDVS